MTKHVLIGLGALAALGGIAYWLERSAREERAALSGGIASAFGPGGYAVPFLDKYRPKGEVTEGSAEEFIITGTFGKTAAQRQREKPRPV